MKQNSLTKEEVSELKELLEKLGCTDIPPKLKKHLDEDSGDELCEKCGFPIHPCLPCEEIAAMYNGVDQEYFGLLHEILQNGRLKRNRTGIDTIGVFGAQAKFDVNMDAFPILTTKKIFFKAIVHELLWFIRGDTNIKYLVDNGVHIWDDWAYARYIKSFNAVKKDLEDDATPLSQENFIKLIKDDTGSGFAKQWGELGEGTYGGMWRAFPYAAHWKLPDGVCSAGPMEGYELKTVDQLKKVMDKLKSNPDDRRMIVSAWHPHWVDHCALPPCHCLFHFNTEELTVEERIAYAKTLNLSNTSEFWAALESSSEEKQQEWLNASSIPKRKLNLLLYQRSCDTFLGVPFNITSYALLLAMVAHCVNMQPGVFTHTYGDLHIYVNHKEQVNLQLSRIPKRLPNLWLNPSVKDLFSFKYEDIKLIDYDSHPAIKGEVAV